MKMYIWCDQCERKIEVFGPIWQGRLSKPLSRMDEEHPGCYAGWVCDSCADKRESGMEY